MKLPIIIAGPTCSGKSLIAIKLAKLLNGEIICADSRQIYKDMRIGTASPTDLEMKEVKHHGYNQISYKQNFNAFHFVKISDNYIKDIQQRNKLPILVGGSGLYLRFFRYGFSSAPPSDQEIKNNLKSILIKNGVGFLHELLSKIDAKTANKISSNDSMRIIRALEIYELTKKKPSSFPSNHSGENVRINAKWILSWPNRVILKKNLYKRIQKMINNGLMKEAVNLKNNIPIKHKLLSTMGYEEILSFYNKEIKLKEAEEKILSRQNKYAKRQYTWFKKETWWNKVDPNSKNIINNIIKIL